MYTNSNVIVNAYRLALAACAAAVFLPWLSWNNFQLHYNAWELYWGIPILIIAVSSVIISVFGPAEMLLDTLGVRSRVMMALLPFVIIGLSLACLAIVPIKAHVESSPYQVVYCSGFYCTMLGAIVATLLGFTIDWAGTQFNPDIRAVRSNAPLALPPQPQHEAAVLTPEPTVHSTAASPVVAAAVPTATVVPADQASGPVVQLTPAASRRSARERAEEKAALDAKMTNVDPEEAISMNNLSYEQFAARRLGFSSRVNEYEIAFLLEDHLSDLRQALDSGGVTAEQYNAELDRLRALIVPVAATEAGVDGAAQPARNGLFANLFKRNTDADSQQPATA